MAALTGKTPAQTYAGLLQLPGGVTGSLVAVQDGLGTSTSLLISSAGIQVAGTFDVTGAVTGIFPSQTGNSGKFLTTDGSAVSWGTVVAGVTTVFGRSGAVSAVAGDYAASQVTNTPAGGISSTTVQTAIDELDSEKLNASAVSVFGLTLVDDADAATARTTLGLGTVAVLSSVSLTGDVTGTLPVANGGTGLAVLGSSLQVLRVDSGGTALEFATIASSVFGRTGAVVAASGDYTASQVTNVPAGTISATTVQAAIDELASEKLAAAVISSYGLTLVGSGNSTQARSTLGLGSLATLSTVPVANGGTNLTSLGSALQALCVNAAGNALQYITLTGGSNGNIQYKSGNSFLGLAASTLATSGTHVLITAQAATDVPVAAKGATSQSANYIEARNSVGNWTAALGPQAGVSNFDTSMALRLRPAGSGREYFHGVYNAGGQWCWGRSDVSCVLGFTPDDTNASFHLGTSGTLSVTGQSGRMAINSRNDGGTSTLELNCRPTDNATGVGGTVNCWTKTGQTAKALAVLAPGGGSTLWSVGPDGEMVTATTGTSTIPLKIVAPASMTADLQQWATSTGVATAIGSGGQLKSFGTAGTSTTVWEVDFASGDSNTTRDVSFLNVGDTGNAIRFKRNSTIIFQVLASGQVKCGSFSTNNDMKVGDYFVQRGGNNGLFLGDTGAGNDGDDAYFMLKANNKTTHSLSAMAHTLTALRPLWVIDGTWPTPTDASRKGRAVFNILDLSVREVWRAESDGTYGLAAFGGAVTAGATLTAHAQGAAYVPLVAKGTTSQTAAIFETRVTSGNATAQFMPSGKLVLKGPAADGSRIGVFLTYDAGGGRTCDLFSDDASNSFTFNPSGHLNLIGATNVNATKFTNRGGSTSGVPLNFFNATANSTTPGVTITQEQQPSAGTFMFPHVSTDARDSGNTYRTIARFGAYMADTTAASWKGGFQVLVSDSAGADRQALRIEADGSTVRMGFFGVTAAVRQTLPAAGVVTADDIRAALINLGLCV